MSDYTVSATFKGERVYLGIQDYPRQQLLTLGFEPVAHPEAEARLIAARAERDETLYDVAMEAVQ